ncbi:hypothetical protein KIS1582_1687 [Cytobacillus firmus]|uniref:Uncharacterized protein n=1 Tax=Cytobacillus firmus TaxID=1399 RepID=A0A800MXZ7_CYTFI|nr:hypothetical protein KIS1582_1687 [Cytobacillus firmus]
MSNLFLKKAYSALSKKMLLLKRKAEGARLSATSIRRAG